MFPSTQLEYFYIQHNKTWYKPYASGRKSLAVKFRISRKWVQQIMAFTTSHSTEDESFGAIEHCLRLKYHLCVETTPSRSYSTSLLVWDPRLAIGELNQPLEICFWTEDITYLPLACLSIQHFDCTCLRSFPSMSLYGMYHISLSVTWG